MRDLKADLKLFAELDNEFFRSADWWVKECYSYEGTEEYEVQADVGDPDVVGPIPEYPIAKFIAESRQGWPEATQRAIAAEERVKELEDERQHTIAVLRSVFGDLWGRGTGLERNRARNRVEGLLKILERVVRRSGEEAEP